MEQGREMFVVSTDAFWAEIEAKNQKLAAQRRFEILGATE